LRRRAARLSLAPLARAPTLAPFFLFVYVQDMTQAVAQILGEVEQLSETERQQLRREIVERVPMSDDLTDDDYAALAAASFRALDDEENTPRA
jgi:aryl carrier-like protein